VRFYKSWDKYGGLSNFSAHPIHMPYVSCPLPSALVTSETTSLAAEATNLASETTSLAAGSSRGSSALAPAVAATPFMPGSHAPHSPDEEVEWGSVEHFYQVRPTLSPHLVVRAGLVMPHLSRRIRPWYSPPLAAGSGIGMPGTVRLPCCVPGSAQYSCPLTLVPCALCLVTGAL